MTDAARYYDRHSHGYTRKWTGLETAVFKPSFYYRRRLLTTAVEMCDPKPGDRVIELGCGNGLVLRELLKRVPRVFGVDISREMLHRVKDSTLSDRKVVLVDSFHDLSQGPSDAEVILKTGNLLELDIPTGSFNRVLSVEVLRYVKDVGRCLRNVAAVMTADAVFVFTVTNLWSVSLFPLGFLARKALGRVNESEEILQYFETERSIRRKVKEAGLEILRLEKMGGLFANPVTRKFTSSEASARRVFELDRRLARAPLTRSLFDMLVIAARKATPTAPR
jgi:SAM-dependent methyltransferase